MGSGRWSDSDWTTYATTNSYATKSTHEIFNTTHLDKDLDPKGARRESRDSTDNPNSNAIIVALDVTGSMSSVIDAMARTGLNTLVNEIYNRKPVTDPHVMCMGIGDVEAGDRAPLQVTQFEADIRIAQQLEKIWLEGGGGGNQYESYALAWYFAAMHTSIDCFEKRGKKGYLFTIGDEKPTPYLRAEDIHRVTGETLESKMIMMPELLTLVSRQWEVFHLVVEEASHGRSSLSDWQKVLGQRAIPLADHTKLAEVVVSAVQICEGDSHAHVTESWDGSTAVTVAHAIKGLVGINKTNVGVATL